jgi:3'(2'), 5'-bisphosphate nucleotidase
MPYQAEHRIAIESVLKACRLCETVRSHFLSNEAIGKEDGSPVTVADFGAQAVVSRHLVASFPDIPLVGEEDSGALRRGENALLKEAVMDHVKRITPDQSDHEVLEAIDRGSGEGGPKGRFWTLDPIDGTKGFLRGGQYAVALALVEEGEVILGVLGCPNLPLDVCEPHGHRGCLFAAVKGEGSTMRGLNGAVERRIEVTKIAHPSEGRFCESFESSHSSHEHAARIAQVLGLGKPPLRMDSQCKYGVVARGDAAIYLRLPTRQSYVETVWDHAAGAIIVQEAGGKVTDMAGKPLDFSSGRRLSNNRGIVVTNGQLHELVLKAVHQVFP